MGKEQQEVDAVVDILRVIGCHDWGEYSKSEVAEAFWFNLELAREAEEREVRALERLRRPDCWTNRGGIFAVSTDTPLGCAVRAEHAFWQKRAGECYMNAAGAVAEESVVERLGAVGCKGLVRAVLQQIEAHKGDETNGCLS